MRILVMAAGTGGHIFPAKAFAEKARSAGHEVEWLGTPSGMENNIVTEFKMHHINMQGVRYNGLKRKLLTPFMLLKSFLQAKKIIKSFKPDVVVGFGGYVTVPGGMAAKSCKKKLIIHEQNAVAGKANKLLSSQASHVFEAFSDVLPGAECVGNPVREELLKLDPPEQRYAERQGPLNILVLGGSRGAQVLNEIVPKTLENFKLIVVRHQSGAGKQAAYVDINSTVSEFIEDMAEAYAWADLVICRAGALTVSECQAVGVAALFVPFPQAVDDHQTKNAKVLADKNAAVILPQSELTVECLTEKLNELLDRNLLKKMAVKAYQFRKKNAVDKILSACE